MDQNVPVYEYPISTAQDTMTFSATAQAPFEMWGHGCTSYDMHDQMAWLSNNNGHYVLPSQEYLTNLHSFTNPALPAQQQDASPLQYQAQACGMPPMTSQSQNFLNSASPTPTHQTFDTLMPASNTRLDRPQSAETMLDSSSSIESKPSSTHSSPSSRAQKFKVPTIKTQFENKGPSMTMHNTPVSDGIQVAPDTDMTTMSNEWMHVHDHSDQNDLHDQSMTMINPKASPALLEPFQWQSPATRRTSLSSVASGPVFSPYSTPNSGIWQSSTYNSPYSQASNWTPVSAHSQFSNSPQSPYPQRAYGTWNRAQYLNALRQNRQQKPLALSLPCRKPRMSRGVTESYAIAHGTLPTQSRTRSAERSGPRGDSAQGPPALAQQLALPEFQLGTLLSTPVASQSEFNSSAGIKTPTRSVLPSSAQQTPMAPPQITPRTAITPNFNALNVNSPYAFTPPFPHVPVPSTPTIVNPVPTPAHQPPLPVPSEPPIADFLPNSATTTSTSASSNHNHPPACGPIRQSPHFEGDIYTPRFKRRNAAGKWEGWCGYCQPGRWLDLKNSRFWEDKLRNHGVCARTKTFFEGPVRVRWVSDRGTIWEGEIGDSGFDLSGREGFDDDGVGRKREGLCGECNTWVGMDGMRSRGKGRCVAWWMHAYKCHEQSRSRTEGAGNFEQKQTRQ